MFLFLCVLQEKLSFHRHSIQWAQPGLYVGILKLRSSVEQIRVLVPQRLPNLLCHTRVRHNAHVTRYPSFSTCDILSITNHAASPHVAQKTNQQSFFSEPFLKHTMPRMVLSGILGTRSVL